MDRMHTAQKIIYGGGMGFAYAVRQSLWMDLAGLGLSWGDETANIAAHRWRLCRKYTGKNKIAAQIFWKWFGSV